jgi:hypothetical protein
MSAPIFTLRGRVAFEDQTAAPDVFVAVVDADPDLDDLLGIGFTAHDGTFRLSFTREAYNQDPADSEELPDPYLVMSVTHRDALVPVLRRDYGKLAFATAAMEEDLGTTVLPLRAGAPPPLPPAGLRPAPGRGKVVKRLRLDDAVIQAVAREIAPLVERLTGWPGLLDGLRFETVDYTFPSLRAHLARALGRADFAPHELALISAVARERDASALAEWDSSARVMRLHRPNLEAQNVDALKVAIGRELVHVGQSRAHPGDDALYERYRAQVWGNLLAGRRAPPELAREMGRFMANVEGYAAYIERGFLRATYTHASTIARPTADADAHYLAQETAHTVRAALPPEEAEEERELVGASKETQYVSGMTEYVTRSPGLVPARYEHDLRPELVPDPEAAYPRLKLVMAKARALRPVVNVRELFERKRAQAAAELAEAEAKALEAGKQRFDLAEFERLYGRGPQDERDRKTDYYIRHAEVQTVMELVVCLQSMEPWEDSR